MKESTLIPVMGKEIPFPNWNIDLISSVLSFEGIDFIYVAEISDEQYAIIHYCDTEVVEPNDKDTREDIAHKYRNLHVRKLLIPLSSEEIAKMRTGKIPMRQLYLQNKIYLIEGTVNCTENIRCWKNLNPEFLQDYLPDEDAVLTEEYLSN